MNFLTFSYSPEESKVIEYGFAGTRFGECVVAVSAQGICGFHFVDNLSAEQRKEIGNHIRNFWYPCWASETETIGKVITGKYFGEIETPQLRLCLRGTPFEIEVWKALLTIPEGTTATYTDVARMIGRPKAVRAVASAVAKNHLGLLVPCHRVVPKSGGVGNYRWGSARKAAILDWEKQNAARN